MIDDAELLRRYVDEKAEAAFSQLVQRHVDFVYAAALRQTRGNAALAQDVAQSVFSDLARKATTLTKHELVVGWLHTATRFAAAKAVRAERRRQLRERQAQTMNADADDPDAPLDWERLQPVLDSVLGELKERERAAILLRFFERKPLAEVGARLSLTESAARSCVDRALDKMRDRLARHGVTSTSSALAVAMASQAGVAAPTGIAASIASTALGAAAAGETAGGILLFMSTTKTIVGVATAIGILLAVGLNLRRAASARSAAEAALARAKSEVNERLATLSELRDRERAADEALASIQAEANEVRVAIALNPPPVSVPARTRRASMPEVRRGYEYLAAHPDVKRVLVERSRARVASYYGPLYRSLSLTPEQIEQFETLMMEEQGVGTVVPSGRATLLPGTGMEREEVEQRVREMLGPQGYQEFHEVSHTIQARRVATDMAAALYPTETPLSSAQLNEIVRVVALTSASTTRTGPNYGGLNPAALSSQFEGTLSPPQLQFLVGMEAQQKLTRAMNPPAAAAGGIGAGTSNSPEP